MSSIEIIFDTDNAAFAESPYVEIQHILNAAKVMVTRPPGEYTLHDSNGNSIGFVRIIQDTP
jgi:hypothetical protein